MKQSTNKSHLGRHGLSRAISALRFAGLVGLCGFVGLNLATPASAQPIGPVEPKEISLRAGVFDVRGSGRPIETGMAIFWTQVEFPFLSRTWKVWPEVGMMTTADHSIYVYFGYRMSLDIGDRWTIRPMFGTGLYEDGVGLDLGGPLHFRSGIEIGYRIDADRRLAAEVYHLSNGKLNQPNPGSESLILTYSVALD